MKYFKKLVGEKIYLSPKNIEDAEEFTKWLNDFNTTDYIGRSGELISLEGEKEYLQNHAKDEASFVIVTLEDNKMIGICTIESINHINRTGTLGIFIGEEEARNKGYGEEAIKLILDYAFSYLNLKNVYLQVMEFNQRAIACYKKCGFKECGRRRKCRYINGNYYDIVYMDILKEEFEESYIKNKNV